MIYRYKARAPEFASLVPLPPLRIDESLSGSAYSQSQSQSQSQAQAQSLPQSLPASAPPTGTKRPLELSTTTPISPDELSSSSNLPSKVRRLAEYVEQVRKTQAASSALTVSQDMYLPSSMSDSQEEDGDSQGPVARRTLPSDFVTPEVAITQTQSRQPQPQPQSMLQQQRNDYQSTAQTERKSIVQGHGIGGPYFSANEFSTRNSLMEDLGAHKVPPVEVASDVVHLAPTQASTTADVSSSKMGMVVLQHSLSPDDLPPSAAQPSRRQTPLVLLEEPPAEDYVDLSSRVLVQSSLAATSTPSASLLQRSTRESLEIVHESQVLPSPIVQLNASSGSSSQRVPNLVVVVESQEIPSAPEPACATTEQHAPSSINDSISKEAAASNSITVIEDSLPLNHSIDGGHPMDVTADYTVIAESTLEITADKDSHEHPSTDDFHVVPGSPVAESSAGAVAMYMSLESLDPTGQPVFDIGPNLDRTSSATISDRAVITSVVAHLHVHESSTAFIESEADADADADAVLPAPVKHDRKRRKADKNISAPRPVRVAPEEKIIPVEALLTVEETLHNLCTMGEADLFSTGGCDPSMFTEMSFWFINVTAETRDLACSTLKFVRDHGGHIMSRDEVFDSTSWQKVVHCIFVQPVFSFDMLAAKALGLNPRNIWWLRACQASGRLLDPHPFVFFSTSDLQTGNVVLPVDQRCLFGKTFYVHPQLADANQWSFVLIAAGATLFQTAVLVDESCDHFLMDNHTTLGKDAGRLLRRLAKDHRVFPQTLIKFISSKDSTHHSLIG
jgi:hypothetical protein